MQNKTNSYRGRSYINLIWHVYCIIKLYANYVSLVFHPVLQIRIRGIPKFLGPPDSDPLVRGLDLDPSGIKQISRKNLDSYFLPLKMKNDGM